MELYAAILSREFKGYIHGFENIHKEKMYTYLRKHNGNIAKSGWKTIQTLNPRNTAKRCSRCGMLNSLKRALYKSIPSDGGAYSKPEPLQRAYGGLERAHPDRRRRLMKSSVNSGEPKADESQELCMSIKDYIA